MSKTIAIVGAGPGVGLAVAERFGREGFQVALLARSLDKLDGLVHKLAELGVEAAAFVADVLDREGLTAALQRVVSRFGSIDVLEYGPLPDLKAMRGPRDIEGSWLAPRRSSKRPRVVGFRRVVRRDCGGGHE